MFSTPFRVAAFEKVSYEQYRQDMRELFPDWPEERLYAAYDAIELPCRATAGSSGYDIRAPFAFALGAGEDICVPTGLRVRIQHGWWLMLIPRSGLGFRLYTRLANTVGNIDSDYYQARNEGHIMIKLRVEASEKNLPEPRRFEQGAAFCQGVFVPYGITLNADAAAERTGGFGSTGQ
ncbi:MAG: deoxyuridine 5'-triphosphate nucleotidohydrolase [Clostridia bacterium]|nr:deoxyuridine 5'-triphosphate nucleotidohydrolase [Clostridia bacterium]